MGEETQETDSTSWKKIVLLMEVGKAKKWAQIVEIVCLQS